jgi:hypothetical protein
MKNGAVATFLGPRLRMRAKNNKIPGGQSLVRVVDCTFSLRNPIFGRISALESNYEIGIGSAPITTSRFELLTIDSIRT